MITPKRTGTEQKQKKKRTSSTLSGCRRACATILVYLEHCDSLLGGRKPGASLASLWVKMGEWITGAIINVVGSISINFGTNLLKLGHNQRERQALLDADDLEDKILLKKSVTQYQPWRIGVVVFSIGNILNFVSFGYAAQSLLAALGSIQFVSNVFFAYLMLNEVVTKRIILATLFIMVGNGFLVAFGNHQSVIYTHEQLLASYKGHIYLTYCAILLFVVAVHHTIYRRGRQVATLRGEEPVGAWRMLLPYSYAVVSGAIGSHSVLFAKSLSVLLRSTLAGDNQLNGWLTYFVFFLFAVTASFWMARLNDGLAMFDAILIVPMLQIVWTFFSIFTGFIYFEEYRVFDNFRATMFGVGVLALFVGMSLLAPQSPQGSKVIEGASCAHAVFPSNTPVNTCAVHNVVSVLQCLFAFDHFLADPSGSVTKAESDSETESAPLISDSSSDHREFKRTLAQHVYTDAASVIGQVKSATRMTVGLGQDRILSSSVFSMPMIASARTPWRTPTLNSEWLIKLTDPHDAENQKGINIRLDSL